MAASTTSRRSVAAKRWKFMSDWIEHLQKYLSYVERAELDCASLQSELKNLCVYMPWPPSTSAVRQRNLHKLREAMELVGLMLLLDKNAWLLIHTPDLECLQQFDPNDYDDSYLAPLFLLKAYPSNEFGGDTIESIAACSTLLSDTDPAAFSAAYERARDRILAELRIQNPTATRFHVPISIVFSPDPTTKSHAFEYIQQAKQLVHTVCTLSGQATSESLYPFKLTRVIFRPWEIRIASDPTNNHDAKSFVESTVALSVQIEEIAVTLVDADVPALGDLLCTAAHPLDRPSHHEGRARCKTSVGTLMVTKNALPAFTALCSALVVSTTISRLHLYDSLDDPAPDNADKENGNDSHNKTTDVAVADSTRQDKWIWLGFALLSRASQSSIRELYIDDNRLLLRDVVALRTAAMSPHPVQELSVVDSDVSDKSTSKNESRQYNAVDRKVRLSSDCHVRLGSSEGDKYPLQSLPGVSSTQFFQVITEDTGTDYTQILIPGYGSAWVGGESVIDVSVVDLHPVATPPRLTSLRLAINNCEKGALASLIRTIGASLVSLEIDADNIRLVQASDVTAILESCPNLKMLSLNRAKLGTLELFTRAYKDKRCKIATLSLCNVEVRNTSLRSFAAALSDPTHAMTKTLREFRYMYGDLGDPDEIARPDAASVKPFLDMLKTNRVLSFFELGLAKSLHKLCAPLFRQLDGKLLVAHPTDLSLEAKLAFLSCVKRHSLDADTSTSGGSGGLAKRVRRQSQGKDSRGLPPELGRNRCPHFWIYS